MNTSRVLMIGLGNLGSHIFDLLTRLPGKYSFLVGGRNLEYLQQRTNLSLFAAMQLGYLPEVNCTYLDLWNVDQTAEIITRFRPDIIVCAATLVRWGATSHLPPSIAHSLTSAQMGPRLPLHLTLVYKLMQALSATGQASTAINAIYPDVVNPVLSKVGLAPTTGIGDLANHIPAIRKSITLKLNKPLEDVEVQLVMARYISYWMSRTKIDNVPFHLRALVNGEDVTHLLYMKTIFDFLPTTFKRIGGPTGLLMTATSAAVVFDAMVNKSGVMTHAPGPNGLPGGYPVRVGRQALEVVLPPYLSLEATLEINEAGLRLDGIEKIGDDGTVFFAEKNMAVFKSLLGYECKRMPLTETEDWAKELQARYEAFARKYQA